MDEEKAGFIIKASLGTCRAVFALIVMSIGIDVASMLKGARYHVLEEEYVSGQEFSPYCRAIVLDFDNAGIQVDFGKYGGGVIASGGTFASPVVVVESYRGDMVVEMKEAETLEVTDCKLMMLPLTRKGHIDRYLLLDGVTGEEIPMPAECGGTKPGLWVIGGSYAEGKEGLWAVPIMITLIIWFLLRLLGIAMELSPYLGFNTEASLAGKFCMHLSSYFLFTVCLHIMLAPINNLKISDLCPQLVTSYYSGKSQIALALFGTLLVADFAILTCAMFSAEAVPDASGFFCSLFGATLFLSAQMSAKAGEMEQKNEDGSGYRFVALILCLIPVLPAGFIILAVAYKVYEILNFNFLTILGLSIDLTLRFPSVDLSAKVNAFHVLTFMLWMMDTLNTMQSCLSKLIMCLGKLRSMKG